MLAAAREECACEMNATSNTDQNIGTRVLFLPAIERRPTAQPVRKGRRFVSDPTNPTPDEIERMTRKVVDEILRGLIDPEWDAVD